MTSACSLESCLKTLAKSVSHSPLHSVCIALPVAGSLENRAGWGGGVYCPYYFAKHFVLIRAGLLKNSVLGCRENASDADIFFSFFWRRPPRLLSEIRAFGTRNLFEIGSD